MKINKKLKIGSISINNRLFLAPMVEVSDLAYRLLCRKYGAGMAYTEMIYIDALLHENDRTKKLIKTCKKDSPVGLQITGNNISEFKKFSEKNLIFDYNLIDINCGCPSIRITGNRAGSFLLENPDKIGEMIKILKDKGVNVSAKIRLGFRKNNVISVAKIIEKAGADALTLHPRLANQGSSIPADWTWIAKVKDKIGIPVIGNGDIFSGCDAEKMLDIADGVMIARGAIGNPFIFREILRYFKLGREKEISKSEKIKCFQEYIKLTKIHDVVDIGRIKYLGSHFLKGFEGASEARNIFMKCKNTEDISKLISKV